MKKQKESKESDDTEDLPSILASMEETSDESENIHHSSPISDIAKAIEEVLSEHPDQKTNITPENEEGLIGIDVLQAHMLASFKYKFPSLSALKESKQEHALSVEGFRSKQIIDIFKSIQTNIVSGDIPLRQKLMGQR